MTVKNRRHGALNPYARFQKEVTLVEVMNSRMIARPLRLLHSCPLADGAGAVILCAPHKLKSQEKKVTVAAAVLTTGTYGRCQERCRFFPILTFAQVAPCSQLVKGPDER